MADLVMLLYTVSLYCYGEIKAVLVDRSLFTEKLHNLSRYESSERPNSHSFRYFSTAIQLGACIIS